MTPIMSGIESIDALTGGCHPGELVLICGRPGMGKTRLLERIVLNTARMAVRNKNAEFVLYFSLDNHYQKQAWRYRRVRITHPGIWRAIPNHPPGILIPSGTSRRNLSHLHTARPACESNSRKPPGTFSSLNPSQTDAPLYYPPFVTCTPVPNWTQELPRQRRILS